MGQRGGGYRFRKKTTILKVRHCKRCLGTDRVNITRTVIIDRLSFSNWTDPYMYYLYDIPGTFGKWKYDVASWRKRIRPGYRYVTMFLYVIFLFYGTRLVFHPALFVRKRWQDCDFGKTNYRNRENNDNILINRRR